MIVSKTNNKRMKRISIVGIILMIISSFVTINSDPLFYYLLHIGAGIIYIYLLSYLISILQFSNENISVQNPFSIFLGLEVVRFIGEVFFVRSAAGLLSGMGILELIMLVYIAISTFKIKSESLAWPFRLLGILLVLTSVTKFFILFSFSSRQTNIFSMYISLVNSVPLMAMFYIVFQTGNIIKNTELGEVNSGD